MKILVTTHHLLRYSGTETYTLTLVRALSTHHQVTVYTHYFNENLLEFRKIKNVKLVTDLKLVAKQKFDIAHVQHNLNAIEVRHYFPTLPIVIQSHGIKPFLEQPPLFDLNISRYLAISDEVQNNLVNSGIKPTHISTFRNMFDENYFYPRLKLSPTIKSALAFSNHSHPDKDALLVEVCRKLNIALDFVGGIYGEISNDELNLKLNQYDVIFTIGRGVIETILAGRVPFIIGNNTYEGFVTPQNFKDLMSTNFSGRFSPQKNSLKSIKTSMAQYNSTEQSSLFHLAVKYFGVHQNLPSLLDTYQQAVASFRPRKIDIATNDYLFNIIQTTREYEQLSTFNRTLELSIIKQSKFYPLYHLYQRTKKEWLG